MLYDDFRKEKMKALKEKDKLKNKVITNILSDLIYIKKELGQEPTEADSAKAVAKQVKQVKEAIEMSKGRPDKLEELEAELAVLEQYMPKQLSDDEIKAEVLKLLEENGIAIDPKNKGAIMKVVMPALSGKADGKEINKVVSSLFLMDARQDFGRVSEKQAERFLRAQRHRILARNYRTRQGEIDIVSLARDGVVVFTEVRSKHDCDFGHPIETVDVRKQKRIRAAAKQFLQAHPRYQAHACRFDVITVVGEGKSAQLEHFLDAF